MTPSATPREVLQYLADQSRKICFQADLEDIDLALLTSALMNIAAILPVAMAYSLLDAGARARGITDDRLKDLR